MGLVGGQQDCYNVDEIKLAKILIYRPAPHVSAASWVVLDRKTR
jgi:hypothetical protein